jgi:hypothetical protein
MLRLLDAVGGVGGARPQKGERDHEGPFHQPAANCGFYRPSFLMEIVL